MVGKQEKRLVVTDMERKLLADTDGEYRRAILEKLQVYKQQVKIAIDQGLAPDDFEVFQRIKKALEAAHGTILHFK